MRSLELAVEYLAGERLIGTAAERAAMSSVAATGWTFVQSSSITSEALAFDFNQHSDDRFYYDLGANASGTWVLTFKMNIDTIGNPSASNYHMKFGMGDNVAGAGTSQGGIFFYLNHGSGYQRFGGKSAYSQTNQAGNFGSSSPSSYGYSADTNYYVKITRSSTTAATVHVYTNSDYTNGLVFTSTLSSVNASLTVRYMKFWTDAYGDQGSNRYHGTVDDINWYDDTTSISGTPTKTLTLADVYPNLPNGAIFEESDTGKHYMFDGSQTWNEIT